MDETPLLTSKEQSDLAAWIELGLQPSVACKKAQVSYQSFRRTVNSDKGFAEAVEIAVERGAYEVLEKVRKGLSDADGTDEINKYKALLKSTEWELERTRESFKPKQETEHKGSIDLGDILADLSK